MALHTLADLTITTTGVAQRINTVNTPCNWFQIQAISAGNTARIGDSNVTSSRGALIAAAVGAYQFAPPAGNTNPYDLYEVWIVGTQGETYSRLYETA